MSIRHLQLERITQRDLQNLIENEVSESKEIEYKEQLPGTSDKDKREFLADVVSFANCMGGDIVYGMKERRDEGGRPTGTPSELVGISIPNLDSLKLRLEDLVRNSTDPRIVGVSLQTVELDSSKVGLVLRIPKSWASPHMVKYQGTSRFYSRNSAGKYQLDVGEIRNAFLQSESLSKKLEDFRLDRLGRLTTNDTSLRMGGKAITVLHLIPFQAFDPSVRFDLTRLHNDPGKLQPIRTGYRERIRYNLEGIVRYSMDDGVVIGYVQMFRSGIMELVDTGLLRPRNSGLLIPGIGYEKEMIACLSRCLDVQKGLGVNAPIAVALSLLGIRGYSIGVSQERFDGIREPIDQDTLVLPMEIIEDYGVHPWSTLRNAFDTIWSASGWPGSLNYDPGGAWRPYNSQS